MLQYSIYPFVLDLFVEYNDIDQLYPLNQLCWRLKINEKIDDGAVILKGGISNKLNDNIEAKYEKLFSITEKLITKSLFKIFNRNKIKSKKSVKSIYNKKPNIFKIIKIYIFFNFIRF